MSDADQNHKPETDADFESMLQAALGGTQHDSIERAVEDLTPREEVPPGHRSGFVAVVGAPNVGKSTLINQILGEKIAIVSAKPQTTRIRQLGILTRDTHQIVFVDTPGIHQAKDQLGAFMVEVAKSALEDADVILFVSDITSPPGTQDQHVLDYLRELDSPEKIIHVMNKVDAIAPDAFKAHFEAYRDLLPDVQFITTAAIDGFHVPDLVAQIADMLPEGPRYYPADQVSDAPIRDIAAEMIREQVLNHTRQEVPHSIAVEVTEFKRRKNEMLYIAATIFTEREGQKGIIIGKRGAMLKTIATDARRAIEGFVDSRVYLELLVKVLPNWRKDEAALKRFGYRL